MNRSTNLNALLNDVTGRFNSSEEEHPEIEALTAYHDGLLSDEDARKLLDHVQVCRDCTGLLLEMSRLGPPDLPQHAEATLEEVNRGWAALQAKLPPAETGQKKPPQPLPFPQKPAPKKSPSPTWYLALAAGLLVAVVGQTMRVQGLQSRLDRLTEPQINTSYMTLNDGLTRGAEDTPGVRQWPTSAESVLLIITPNVLLGPQTKTYEDFRAEIIGRERRWEKSGLRLGEERSFSMLIQRSYFGTGELQLRIHGLSAGKEDMLTQFKLTLDST